MRHEGSVRGAIGMVVCAILSLVAFLVLIRLVEGGLLPASLALIISLSSSVVGPNVEQRRKGSEQQVQRQLFGNTAASRPKAALTDIAI
jgi:hypothetical protein